MKIKSLIARPILDSRGTWTMEVSIELQNGVRATASVPQGKSTGSAEAHALPALQAVRSVNKIITPLLKRVDIRGQDALDTFLNKLDGTPLKKKLGANAILATSVVFLKAMAKAEEMPLWKHIRSIYGIPVHARRGVAYPRIFVNIVNGGLHSGNNLDIQEYMIIPKCRTIAESVATAASVYHALGDALVRIKGKTATGLGDEGGYAPNFKDNIEPFRMFRSVVQKLHLSKSVDFGIDAAAANIKRLSVKELMAMYTQLVMRYGLIYLEDIFDEEDFGNFAAANARFGKKAWITGDDLTTTNVRRMERAHAEGSVNAVIIKPNQIGSVTETLDAVRAARRYGWGVIVSHRSGETNDDFIADLAYGVGADGLKSGAPARGERIAKYNRLLEIEKEA